MNYRESCVSFQEFAKLQWKFKSLQIYLHVIRNTYSATRWIEFPEFGITVFKSFLDWRNFVLVTRFTQSETDYFPRYQDKHSRAQLLLRRAWLWKFELQKTGEYCRNVELGFILRTQPKTVYTRKLSVRIREC